MSAIDIEQTTVPVPAEDSAAAVQRRPPLLEVKHLSVRYLTEAGAVPACEDVNLTLRPAMPTSAPDLTRDNTLRSATPEIDLGLPTKCVPGEAVTLGGLIYGQWVHLSVNGTGQDLGWHFPTLAGEVTFVVPEGTKAGRDDLIVRDVNGQVITFGRFHVSPKA